MKPIKLLGTILLRITLISAALVLFFSLMAGMYYNSSPTSIRLGICDEDHSPLSRSIIYNLRSSQFFDITEAAADYLELQKLIDEGKIDAGIVIPYKAYHDVLNKQTVNILAVLNGTANSIVPKTALMTISNVIMTINNQLDLMVRVEDLGGIPNSRHIKTPLLMVNERIFHNPSLSMEASMLPAFMGLAMQIVSMLIVLFAVTANFKIIREKMKQLKAARQLPVKALIPPFIISWLIVGMAISIAFFTTMHLFKVPFNQTVMWQVVAIIFLFVLSMESISYFLVLNIRNGAVLAGIITLIVTPAFMYSGYLVPFEQMADLPKAIGGMYPLRYYLQALYTVFNHHLDIAFATDNLNVLWKFSGVFGGLSLLSILFGQYERKKILKKQMKSSEQNSSETISAGIN
ncbi:MAG: ABC transporter permease [Candidatus Ratteibacteria bacterium]